MAVKGGVKVPKPRWGSMVSVVDGSRVPKEALDEKLVKMLTNLNKGKRKLEVEEDPSPIHRHRIEKIVKEEDLRREEKVAEKQEDQTGSKD